ncbi:MAG: iron chelate uptake ABC transporter family permease subunit [Phycisphaeraceae bacterium]
MLIAATPTLDWPSADQWARVLLLRDYNTRVVVLGVMMFAIAAGLIGTFMLLRRRALLSDAVSHATLPGIALAFIIMVMLGGSGKSLSGLLIGAGIFGGIGMIAVMLIRGATRLKDDVALGIVLSVTFGLGAALIKLCTEMPGASAAGLDRFIYGSAATMLYRDAVTMLVAAAVVAIACALLYKEFALVCFDQEYAGAQGWPVARIDITMMGLTVAVTTIGLQAVGLVLVVAMLIIPPAAARFWTDRLLYMTIGSAVIGMVSGYLGAIVSGLVRHVPTGPVIVVVAAGVFLVSMMFGVRRGLIVRLVEHLRLTRRVAMQHLLRAAYEQIEAHGADNGRFSTKELQSRRSWPPRQLHRLLATARRCGWIEPVDADQWRFTDAGRAEAEKVVRNHRLWELYLITHAEIAPSHVDRDADAIEHVLGAAMVEKLEDMLESQAGERGRVPPSPHAI